MPGDSFQRRWHFWQLCGNYPYNLLTRAADVMLKERRRLVLLARETPLNQAHIQNMLVATQMGAVIYPPVPALYTRPASIEEMIDFTVMRVFDLFEIDAPVNLPRWSGMSDLTKARSNERSISPRGHLTKGAAKYANNL